MSLIPNNAGTAPTYILENPELEVIVEQDGIEPRPSTSPAPLEAVAEPVKTAEDVALPALDPEILLALGEVNDEGPTWGQSIHTNLSQLWEPLLKNGLPKEIKENLLKQYIIPENCKLLQAPKLNNEIAAAIHEMTRQRDKKVELKQRQLGIGVTAISKAMTTLLTSDSKIEAIKILSDGCRILCDLHHSETQSRIKMITPGLAKPFLNVIQDSARDETLFGSNLSEKIKASITIEKQGLQIKKTALPPRISPSASQNVTPARQQYQGNWSCPPRYPTNRGGRGNQKRYPPSSRRSAAATIAPAHPKPSFNRPRAPPRQ